MLRPVLCLAVCLAPVACGRSSAPPAATSTTPIATEPPATAPVTPPLAPPAPRIEAHALFTQWLDALNAGDAARLAAFAEHLTPDVAKQYSVEGELGFLEDTGGFDLKKTEESTAQKLVAIGKERGGDQYARFVFELDDTSRVRTFDVIPVPVPAEYKPARLSEADALAALRAELDALVAKDRFAGAVIVAKGGKPIFAQAYGMADRAKKVANTLDTRFRIGSMNKMFTATAILQLVQAKKLSLDDTVGKHLPDYPNPDVATKVTIHHLLTHTGGTGDIFGPDYEAKRLELRTLADYVTLYGGRALLHEPGKGERYSNYGFVLLGVIVEKVAKQSYYDYLETNVFKRAKMTSTSSPFEDKPMTGRSARSVRSIAYTRNLGGKRLAAWTDAKDTLPIRATSAGGGDSTVGDLLKFANALAAHKLLDKRHTELLTARKTGVPEGGYAYGFGTNEEDGIHCLGHGGGAPGMNGELQLCDSGYTIVVLANVDPPAAGRVARFVKARLPAP